MKRGSKKWKEGGKEKRKEKVEILEILLSAMRELRKLTDTFYLEQKAAWCTTGKRHFGKF